MANGGRFASVQGLRLQVFDNIGHDFRGDEKAADSLVSSDLVGVQPEKWMQCEDGAEGFGVWQLSDGLGLVAQAPSSDGTSRVR